MTKLTTETENHNKAIANLEALELLLKALYIHKAYVANKKRIELEQNLKFKQSLYLGTKVQQRQQAAQRNTDIQLARQEIKNALEAYRTASPEEEKSAKQRYNAAKLALAVAEGQQSILSRATEAQLRQQKIAQKKDLKPAQKEIAALQKTIESTGKPWYRRFFGGNGTRRASRKNRRGTRRN